MDDNQSETRQERREKKLQKKREQIAKHGRSLAKVYMDAVLKRLGRGKVSRGLKLVQGLMLNFNRELD